MGAILGIGCTHGPQLQFPDPNMADILRGHAIPDAVFVSDQGPGDPVGFRHEEPGVPRFFR